MTSVAVKVLVLIIGIGVAILLAGLTGALFWIWPTAWPHEHLSVGPAQYQQLQALRAEPKFLPGPPGSLYPGAADVQTRVRAEAGVNALIDDIVVGLPRHSRKSFVLGRFKAVLMSFRHSDTEDQEQLGAYLNRIMDVLGIRSSNQLLMVWRYGFPYGWVLRT